MKLLKKSFNLYPMYEREEVMHLVFHKGLIEASMTKTSIVIKSTKEVIAMINDHYPKAGGHISYFNDVEYIFSRKDYIIDDTPADNINSMRSISIKKVVLTGYGATEVTEEHHDCPWYPTYTELMVEGQPIYNINID